ncbi:MAG: hypothetical protein ABSF82_12035 [Candidatus Bathyarchaeia archaeon]|jgi:hypothetical protein
MALLPMVTATPSKPEEATIDVKLGNRGGAYSLQWGVDVVTGVVVDLVVDGVVVVDIVVEALVTVTVLVLVV